MFRSTRRRGVTATLAACLMASCATVETEPGIVAAEDSGQRLMQWSDLTNRPLPEPAETFTYGDHEAQIVDLWRPAGAGPHPVVLMIHGGCWQKSIADRTLMNYAAAALVERGIAVWNIEYRGVDEAGGGYPGTFQDVSDAADLLLETGPALGLDMSRLVVTGHSAGGHLAAWLATRANLPEDSPLATGEPLPISAVIVTGGLADLSASTPVTLPSCLANIRNDLTGLPTTDRPDVLAETSPAELLPAGPIIISVNGDSDRIAPPLLGRGLTETIRAAGGRAEYVEISNTGHVELIAPGTDAFDAQLELLETYLE